jgi:hypothetical protein
MKRKFFLPFSALIFSAVWFLLFLAGQSRLVRDPGTFFHTAAGDHLLETGHLIHQDFYSFTRFGEPWIAQQWLGEIIMAVVHRIAGLDGLLVVTVSLIALLWSCLALRIERSGMNLLLGSLILALALATSSHHLHIRPHIVTILFMTLVYSWLCDVEAGRKSVAALLGLIPIFVLWANIHGGALGGIFTLLVAATGWTLARLLGLKSPMSDRRSLTVLWVVAFLGFASPLVNPYGLKLPLTWMDIMGSDAVSELIQEHASVLTLLRQGDMTSYVTIFVILSLGLFYMALLAGTKRHDWRFTWFIPLVWFLLSLSRIRHAPLFAAMVVIAIAEIFPYCRWVQKLGERGLITFRVMEVPPGSRAQPSTRYLLAAAITVFSLVAFHGSAQLPSSGQKWVTLDGTHWPIGILPELQAIEESHPRGTPIFNDMLFGGFLIYHAPGLRVFIDDRCELYGDEFITKYVKAEESDFIAWSKAYRFDLAILTADSNYSKYFEGNTDWRVVKRCPAGVLYEKR